MNAKSSRDKEKEIEANLARAEESLRASKELLQAGYSDIAASRAYYAAFYAVTAALLHEGLQFRKHSAVVAAVHKNFVRTGKLDKNLGKDINWLFELRAIKQMLKAN